MESVSSKYTNRDARAGTHKGWELPKIENEKRKSGSVNRRAKQSGRWGRETTFNCLISTFPFHVFGNHVLVWSKSF